MLNKVTKGRDTRLSMAFLTHDGRH